MADKQIAFGVVGKAIQLQVKVEADDAPRPAKRVETFRVTGKTVNYGSKNTCYIKSGTIAIQGGVITGAIDYYEGTGSTPAGLGTLSGLFNPINSTCTWTETFTNGLGVFCYTGNLQDNHIVGEYFVGDKKKGYFDFTLSTN